jgi:hypothetical protein
MDDNVSPLGMEDAGDFGPDAVCGPRDQGDLIDQGLSIGFVCQG